MPGDYWIVKADVKHKYQLFLIVNVICFKLYYYLVDHSKVMNKIINIIYVNISSLVGFVNIPTSL